MVALPTTFATHDYLLSIALKAPNAKARFTPRQELNRLETPRTNNLICPFEMLIYRPDVHMSNGRGWWHQ